jgi:hypothetical protein
MPIKTFRGLIADGEQDTIVLHTSDGATGYRIVKFEIFPNLPGTQDIESTVQIWKESQSGISATTSTVDFSDQRLLGASYYAESSSSAYNAAPNIVIFDREIFNQDIYVTNTETVGSQKINYYIELEQMALDINANTVATLKDIRNQA